MWRSAVTCGTSCPSLRAKGVTIILTTHYIEEAEEIADRVGVINGGELLLVEEKTALMKKLGRKQLFLELAQPVEQLPESLASFGLTLSEDGCTVTYEIEDNGEQGRIADVLSALSAANIHFKDISTRQSSLEDIFVSLVGGQK